MNTCGTCKHFGKPYDGLERFDPDTDELIECKRFHVCNLLQHLNECTVGYERWNDPAGTIDGSGYHAAFCVSEEFGCNQWTERTASQPDA